MSILRKLSPASPTPTADRAFTPPPLAINLEPSSTTDFESNIYAHPYTGKRSRVLMICTEERNITMESGKKFPTGCHPVELGFPMLHLVNAEPEFDVVTSAGAPVATKKYG